MEGALIGDFKIIYREIIIKRPYCFTCLNKRQSKEIIVLSRTSTSHTFNDIYASPVLKLTLIKFYLNRFNGPTKSIRKYTNRHNDNWLFSHD